MIGPRRWRDSGASIDDLDRRRRRLLQFASPMMTDDDRRRHPRVRLDGRATGRATVFAEFNVVALSESGASLEMAAPLALDSSCDITLNLAHVAVDLKGRVVHVGPALRRRRRLPRRRRLREVDELDQALLESFLDRERHRANA